MKISLITRIDDAEFEDLVIKTLISDESLDIALEFRAITEATLSSHIYNRSADDSRLILIRDSADSENSEVSISKRIPNLITTYLDSRNCRDVLAIREEVSRALRVWNSSPTKSSRKREATNLTVVTGTTGAPGITTIAINLAYEFSRQRRINLVDAYQKRRDVAFLLGGKRKSERVILSASLSVSSDLLEEDEVPQIADIGSAPDFNIAFTDRRLEARTYVELLEAAKKIVYLMTPDNNHMYELEGFLDLVESRSITGVPYFILNQVGNSSRERSIQKRFKARTGNYFSGICPYDRDGLERAKAAYSALYEVAPRSRLRRAISDFVPKILE